MAELIPHPAKRKNETETNALEQEVAEGKESNSLREPVKEDTEVGVELKSEPAPSSKDVEEVGNPDNRIGGDIKGVDDPKQVDGKIDDVPVEEEPKSPLTKVTSEPVRDDHHDVPDAGTTIEPLDPSTGKQGEDTTNDKDTAQEIENIQEDNDKNDAPSVKEIKSSPESPDTEKEAKDDQHKSQGSSSGIRDKEDVEIKDVNPGSTEPAVLKDDTITGGSTDSGAAVLQLEVEDSKVRADTSANEETPLLHGGQTSANIHPTRKAEERRLVAIVVGATGSGKSATANTLVGQSLFKESSGAVTAETSVKKHTVSLVDIDFSSSKSKYPHLSQERLKELRDADATEEQLKKADGKAKDQIEKRLKGCGHISDTQGSDFIYTSLKVVDTPGSWNPKGVGSCHDAVIYIIVINLASPRFSQQQLDTVKSMRGWGCENIVKSEKALVVLTHAESALGDSKTLHDYIEEVKGDPLHTFLTQIRKDKYMAVNNASMSEYETNVQRQSLLRKMDTYASSCDCCNCLLCCTIS